MPALRNPSLGENTIGRILIAAMAIGFLSLLVAAGAAGYVIRQGNRHADWVIHTYRVESVLTEARRLAEQQETARRGYMLAGTPAFLASFERAHNALVPQIAELRRLTADNPNQQAPMQAVIRRLAAIDTAQRETNMLVQQGRGAEALRRFRIDSGLERMTRLRRVFDIMGREERRLLAMRDAEQMAGRRTFSVVVAISALLFVLVAVISFMTIRRYTRDLHRSRTALATLNATLEDQVNERTADLALANEEIQRFAYIVSHDLRSPLVNIMGFTSELEELRGDIFRRIATLANAEPVVPGTDGNLPEPALPPEDKQLSSDFSEALGFIKSSIGKMDRLINAILNLTREGRREFRPVKIDTRELIETIASTVAHQASETETVIHVEPLPEIVSDRLALEQIFGNLIDNALKYLKHGVPGDIRVKGRSKMGFAIFEIVDNGRGIDPKDHQRIFDLFRRAGTQDKPGQGIGLAHVRALVRRLGGTMSVSSELGNGSTFTVTLPARWTGKSRNETA